ncbi:membrane-bound lysozyme-inhibitor of c-type lysozyme family protein [Ochrobactrum quorumnocens]|uniref:Membrane-bound lysozyme-inhibitor of c-type lysozyme family protein n=1 Tax=Ochrobactrum quorumnocens TaxID=271865 RepID=A0A248UES1_9HYPH|nr:MliC family protein [[Ochrobactrum] quorumnocens]ASV85215.1 membrane-bound lysozyme-inhibitor of c-type lysozyme family protein [[Ochrobactrum] quorumnocens]
MRKGILLLGLSLAASSASAGEINITLPDDIEVTTNSVLYTCGDKNVSATYYNAGDVSLAELEMEDHTVVAANVISGSGAKYAGGIYIWWTKGETADLYNLMDDPEQEKPISCVEQ